MRYTAAYMMKSVSRKYEKRITIASGIVLSMEDYPTTKFSDEARIPVGKCFDVITVKDAVLEMASKDFRWDERMTASRNLSVKVHVAENGATITTLFDTTKEAMGQEENRWIDTLYLHELSRVLEALKWEILIYRGKRFNPALYIPLHFDAEERRISFPFLHRND